MVQEKKKQQDRQENPFYSKEAAQAVARAFSIVLSEHYGYRIVVEITPKNKDVT